jgi:hypothetical protein
MKTGEINTDGRTSIVAKWFAFLLHIWKVTGSNLGPDWLPS